MTDHKSNEHDSGEHDHGYLMIEAAGGVVSYGSATMQRFLIMFRRGVWDLPKGKVDPGETLKDAAIREVVEETGITPPRIRESIGKTLHHYELEGKQIQKITYWYWMEAKSMDVGTPQLEEGITKLKWVSLDEAKQKVGFDNLRLVLDAYGQKKWGDEFITP